MNIEIIVDYYFLFIKESYLKFYGEIVEVWGMRNNMNNLGNIWIFI